MTTTELTVSEVRRTCARCRKELTDAASREAGIGPICRKLDNAILAVLIPGNPSKALGLVQVEESKIPAPAIETLHQVQADLMDLFAKDWRKTVKRLEWILSWPLPHQTFTALRNAIEALGYVALAALIDGQASTGKATVGLTAGRLFIIAPRNKYGQSALKSIPGRKFHPAVTNAKAFWSVPRNQHEAFRLAVLKYWPCASGIEEAVENAKTDLLLEGALGEELPPNNCPLPSFSSLVAPTLTDFVKVVGGKVIVKAPYSVDFIQALKELPYKSRKWDSVGKVWEVSPVLKSQVESLVTTHFLIK